MRGMRAFYVRYVQEIEFIEKHFPSDDKNEYWEKIGKNGKHYRQGKRGSKYQSVYACGHGVVRFLLYFLVIFLWL